MYFLLASERKSKKKKKKLALELEREYVNPERKKKKIKSLLICYVYWRVERVVIMSRSPNKSEKTVFDININQSAYQKENYFQLIRLRVCGRHGPCTGCLNS